MRILGTDISPLALAHARIGRYRSRSVRDVGAAARARWLYEDGDRMVVGDPLRALVTFARHNLVRDPFPPLGEAPFDLILCRNVLIYFDTPTVGRVLASFESARAPSGDAGARGGGRAVREREPDRRRRRSAAGRPAAAAPPAGAAGAARLVRARTAPPATSSAVSRSWSVIEPAAAVTSLRRALYAEPDFGLAAFKLGGAHEALGDVRVGGARLPAGAAGARPA